MYNFKVTILYSKLSDDYFDLKMNDVICDFLCMYTDCHS